jgi:hypothetical protein
MQLWLQKLLVIPIIAGLCLVASVATTTAQTKMEKLHVGYSAVLKHGLDVELLFIQAGRQPRLCCRVKFRLQ